MAGLGTGGSPLSPGVYPVEVDLSITVPRVSTSIGAFVGTFDKGPVGDYRLITNADELADVYGLPMNSNYNHWFQAKMFFDNSDKLYISRAVDIDGNWQRSGALIATAINEPPVGAPGINTVDVAYSEADLIDGSWLRFTLDANQRKYKVVGFNETFAPVFQSDEVDFSGATFPCHGTTTQSDVIDFGAYDFNSTPDGDVFAIDIDGNEFSYTTVAGDSALNVMGGLETAFAASSINNVTLESDASTLTMTVTSKTEGATGAYVISVGASDTTGQTNITNVITAQDGEVFAVNIDGTVVSVTAHAGDVVDTVIAALDAKFATVGINNVDFEADYDNNRIVVIALEGGLNGVYTIGVDASDTAGLAINSLATAANGLATLTLDMEIDWDYIPGQPGSKQIPTGTGQLEYIYTIAVNALTESKVDAGDFSSQVSTIQLGTGTYNIGDNFEVDITEHGFLEPNHKVTYTVKDDGTGNPESRNDVVKGIYNAILTSNPSSLYIKNDEVLGTITLTAKYPGSIGSFYVTSAYSSFQQDEISFGGATFPTVGGEVFAVNVDNNVISYTAGVGESPDNVINGLVNAWTASNATNVKFIKDLANNTILVKAVTGGVTGMYSISVDATDTAGTTVTNIFVPTGTMTTTDSEVQATDGTTPISSYELFATRDIYLNEDDFKFNEDSIRFSAVDSKLKFICRWVGDSGNDIDVTIAKASDFNVPVPNTVVTDVSSVGIRTLTTTKVSPILGIDGIALDTLFDYVPSDDEIAIIVSVKGEIVERYIVSLDETKKDFNGKSKYIEDVINLKSSYIYVKDNKALDYVNHMPESSVLQTIQTTVEQWQVSTGQKIGKSVTEVTIGELLNLQHGDSGLVGRGDYQRAWDVFSDKESIEVDVLIANEETPKYVAELAKSRGDCIAFIGAPYELTVGLKTTEIIDNLVDYIAGAYGDLNIENSYATFFGNYLYIYDKVNDKMRWVNAAGATAGLRAKTNTDFQTWFASAGLVRGQIQGVDKLAFIPNQGQRDVLYKNKINPIASFPGQGNAVVWGQKTMLSRPSSFDRVNVRGLFNQLKRAISKMAKYYVFELNDEYTRARFVESITPYLEFVQENRGVYDFAIQCDENNNTAAVIDANQFVASIFVKPERVAEFLILNFVAVGTGVDFKEIYA